MLEEPSLEVNMGIVAQGRSKDHVVECKKEMVENGDELRGGISV